MRHPNTLVFIASVALTCCLLASSIVASRSFACATGFIEGMPRAIQQDKKKSLALGTVVRRFELYGAVYFVPTPHGFRDIEEFTNSTLPERLHVRAFNLREYTLAYTALEARRAGGRAFPLYSQADLDICRTEDVFGGICREDPQKTPDTTQLKDCDAIFTQQAEGPDNRRVIHLRQGLGAEDLYGDFLCVFRKQDVRVAVTADAVEGDWNPDERAKAMKWARESHATGGVAVPKHKAISAELRFRHNGRGIFMRVAIGPIRDQSDYKRALESVLQWKEMFVQLNPAEAAAQ